MPSDLLTTAFVHDGDSYTLELELQGQTLTLLRILFYFQNQNVQPTAPSFWDLDREVREVLLSVVRRKWPGRTLKI